MRTWIIGFEEYWTYHEEGEWDEGDLYNVVAETPEQATQTAMQLVGIGKSIVTDDGKKHTLLAARQIFIAELLWTPSR